MGEDYHKNLKRILECYEVVGCMDSGKKPENGWEKEHYIDSADIFDKNFDKILICSRKYKEDIKISLLNKGVEYQKIITLDDMHDNPEKYYQQILKDMDEYQRLNTDQKFTVEKDSLWFITNDKEEEAGKPKEHYFAQDIWAAQRIYRNNPKKHYDIGSSLNGFIAHLLVFMEVYYIDIRPMKKEIPGLHYIYGDAMCLKDIEDGSIESLSSLSAMEHFGLGRYNDPITPDGYMLAARNMQRVLKSGGKLYLSVPVGPADKLVFNAHRIFKIETVLELFDMCRMQEVKVIDPGGVEAYPVEQEQYGSVQEYSCGLFEFEKV